ncbi:hypothetical protein [Ancylobacter polymorphus]|uniref:Twin-arginine translocation pathway signal protein n=1 Tax=Ancylobacter polymorphus TaxID=223390 RepID=A0ABU0BHN5_9HYPH|nr:hypothetical protein [Ancylobacter polymorphus]MDQ0305340.1 hypothetical protein [Ancylobacter polymorphus]
MADIDNTTPNGVSTTRRGFFGHAAGAYLAAGAVSLALEKGVYDPEAALRRAAEEIRKAMKAIGSESYMIMVREEQSGQAVAKHFDRNGKKHWLIELA